MKITSKSHKRTTKLLAILLSVLMILGAMPIFTFAADGDTATDEIVTKWPVAEKEIEFSHAYAEAGLIGGEASIPGEFVYVSATAKAMSGLGVYSRDINFVPTDTTIAPIPGKVDVTVVVTDDGQLTGVPTSTSIQIGQKLKVSDFVKTGIKIKCNTYSSSTFDIEWKEPEKVMNEIGTFTETVECSPRVKKYKECIAPFEMQIEVTVNEIDPDKVWLEEVPTFTEPLGGLTIGESCKFSGGLVTKGGKEIPGTWAWRNPDSKLYTDTYSNHTMVFTPDDPTACEPVEVPNISIHPLRDAPTGELEIVKVPVASAIEVGQTLADSTLTGGEAEKNLVAVPGTFSWKDPTIAPAGGTADQTAIFTPDDSSVGDPIEVKVPVTVFGAEIKTIPHGSNIEVGHKLSESTLTGGLVVKGDKEIPGTWAWKNPETVMEQETSNTYEPVIFTPDDPNACPQLEGRGYLEVRAYTIVEMPKYDYDFIPGETYGKYPLTGGVVTKNGEPIMGKFEWQSPNEVVQAGKNKTVIIYKPDSWQDGSTDYIDVEITVEKIPLEIQWPDIKGYYAVGGKVGENISGYQGTANMPGRFDIYYESYGLPVPDKVGGTADVEITFDPVAKDYETQSKIITVTFEAPEPNFHVKVDSYGNDKNNTNVRCSIGYVKNWPLHTGNFYLVVDGKRHTEITELSDMGVHNKLSAYLTLTDLSYGEHEFSCEYVAGENDVYKSAKSDVVKYMVKRYCELTVVHYGGGTVTNTYAVGSSVTVSASNHDKPYYSFDKWEVEGTPLPEGTDTTQQEMTFVMPDGDVKLTATYKLDFGSFIKYGFQKVVTWFIGFIPQVIEFIKGILPQQ